MPPSSSGSQGELHALGPAGAAPLLEAAVQERRTGWYEFEGPWGLVARLRLRGGHLVEASCGELDGPRAALRIFLWSHARCTWRALDDCDGPKGAEALDADLSSLITEGLRQRAVWQRMLQDLPPLGARFEVDFTHAGALAELPAVARLLCRLCDGRRSLGEVLRDGPLPDLEAVSTLAHLIAERVLVPATESTPAPVGDEIPAVAHERDGEQTEMLSAAMTRWRPPWRLAVLGAAAGLAAAVLIAAQPRAQSPASADPTAATAAAVVTTEKLNIRSVLAGPSTLPAIAVASDHRPSPSPPGQSQSAISTRPAPPSSPARSALLAACERAREQRDAGRALVACQRAVSSGAERADLLAYLAQAELERGRFLKAAAHAGRAVALDPKLAEAYAYLGFAQSEAGRKREAMAAYRQYLALAPRGRYAEDVRAIVRAGAGER